MKCVFLYHSQTGKGKIAKKLPYIERRLREKYDAVDLVETTSSEDMEAQASRCAKEYDAVIFSGGDGTFYRVLNGVVGSGVALGYLPSGTVNDIARSLRIPRSIKGALKVILEGDTQALDCMQVGERYTMYISACGAFTSATYETEQKYKRALGYLAYAFHAFRKNMKLQIFPATVWVDGKQLQSSAVLLFVLNGKSVAGFPVNRKGSMKDGTLEFVAIKQVQKPNLWQKLGKYFSLAGLLVFGCRIRKKDFVFYSGKQIKIQTDPSIVWDFDGEKGSTGDLTVTVCPQSVNMYVPKGKKI